MVNVRHRDKKLLFNLSDRQRNILIGSLLGDANINLKGKECRVFFKHSVNQAELLKWKRKEFEGITGMPINRFEQRVKGKKYGFVQFVTLTHPAFTVLHKVFYRDGKKIVPKNVDRILISPISLATWIMDDGAKDNAGLTIQTHSFKNDEVGLLIRVLRDNFDLIATSRKNKGKSIIYFPQAEIKKLWEIVGSHILPEYRYKFPAPVETVRRAPI